MNHNQSHHCPLEKLKNTIHHHHYIDENELVQLLLTKTPPLDWQKIEKRTIGLVENAREDKKRQTMMDALLSEYSLSNKEGVLLMCLAEALIRIPDEKTAEKFIHSVLNAGDWKSHIEKDHSLLINASTWALMFGGRVVDRLMSPEKAIGNLISRVGLNSMHRMIKQSLTIIAKQFVLSTTIEKALPNAKNELKEGYLYTFDMLGEAALTEKDASAYFEKYKHAIEYLANKKQSEHTVSIKLSALYPRYEYRQREDVLNVLYQRVEKLVLLGITSNIAISIDAEESERLFISLELIEKLMSNPAIESSKMLGVVVQAYSKRCLSVLTFLNHLAKQHQTIIPIRLVKGAYWDTEIKKSQQMGLDDFPVFTRKENTDLNYLVAANYLFDADTQKNLLPQFATHNAHTISSILEMAKINKKSKFEFQKLHGMGQTLYAQVLDKGKIDCRIYAPIGKHQYLLPYLVRRLLENGANTSFVNRLIDAKLPAKNLATHPHLDIQKFDSYRNLNIKKPLEVFYPRKNSKGVNLQDLSSKLDFEQIIKKYQNHTHFAKSLLGTDKKYPSQKIPYFSPNHLSHQIAEVELLEKNQDLVDGIYKKAKKAYDLEIVSIEQRAAHLLKYADLLEQHREELIALCVFETGKVYQDAVDEIREAVDFCRYYASLGLKKLAPEILPSPTGEKNQLSYSGKGVFLCISPWNFPLAIFTGQVVSCYMAGNSVIAKPSPLSPIIANKAVQLMHQAGMSKNTVQLVLCLDEMNAQLTSHKTIDGVMFTGSTSTAKIIQKSLVARKNTPIATFIAETGGLNAMIVDSTALSEQVVIDMLSSSFQSAGQRCSALRIALIQESVYDEVLALLKGAMQLLKVNHAKYFTTDIGPVIDKNAQQKILNYLTDMKQKFSSYHCEIHPKNNGYYIAPHLIELNQFEDLKEEIFAPVLHLCKYKNNQLDLMIEKINQSGYGLTLGIHSRNQQTQQRIVEKAKVGNIYINRNQIGAIVGSQPFGGRAKSGTGPKAGGPNYLMRLVDEKTVSNNIAAIGGNPDLLAGIE